MTLHLLYYNKFTKSFYDYVSLNVPIDEQQFLFISDTEIDIKSRSNLYVLKSPIGKNIFYNLTLFFKLCFKSERIVLHGAPILYFFLIYPWFIRKLSWIIYGEELYNLENFDGITFIKNSITKNNNKEKVAVDTPNQNFITLISNKFVLSSVKNHITHVQGDSDFANKLFKSKATFIYSPIYLSNVVDTNKFLPIEISKKQKVKVLVGSSSDTSNNHEEIFQQIYTFKDEIEFIYCPLSYGNYPIYKKRIITEGRRLFGDKFIPLEDFMGYDKYKYFLEGIDVAIFDHHRQEAMGVTLSLLSLGKIVYVNSSTTSYTSFVKRGFQVFDNRLLYTLGFNVDRDVTINRSLLQKYYSEAILKTSLQKISNL